MTNTSPWPIIGFLQTSSVFTASRDGVVYLFKTDEWPVMDVVMRSNSQTFVDMVKSKLREYELIVNGTFNKYDRIGAFWRAHAPFTDPFPVSEVRPTGPVISNGMKVYSEPGAGKYFLAYLEEGSQRRYLVGPGDPPEGTKSGLGGLGGLVEKSRPFDGYNEYNLALLGNRQAPLEGEPPPEFMHALTKRGNKMYRIVESRSEENHHRTGKIAIGIGAQSIIIAVQPDGVIGVSMDKFRDLLIKAGAIDGVILDCSDSVCLAYRGEILEKPAPHKNYSSVIGLGFRR